MKYLALLAGVIALFVSGLWAIAPKPPFVSITGDYGVRAGALTYVKITVHKSFELLKGEDIQLSLTLSDEHSGGLDAPELIRVRPPTSWTFDGDIEWTVKAFKGQDPTFVVSFRLPKDLPSSAKKVCFLVRAYRPPDSWPLVSEGTSDHNDFCAFIER